MRVIRRPVIVLIFEILSVLGRICFSEEGLRALSKRDLDPLVLLLVIPSICGLSEITLADSSMGHIRVRLDG